MSVKPGPINRLSGDLMTQIAGFTPPQALARLAGTSKAWHVTISTFLPPSVARLAERCTKLVLQSGSGEQTNFFKGYLTALRMHFPPDQHFRYCDPRSVKHDNHKSPFDFIQRHLFVERPNALALNAPLVAYQGAQLEELNVGDLRTGVVSSVNLRDVDPIWIDRPLRGLSITPTEPRELRAVGRRGIYEVTQNEEGWVAKRGRGLLEEWQTSRYSEGRLLAIDTDEKRFNFYQNDLWIFELEVPEAYFHPHLAAEDCCYWSGRHFVLPLSDGTLGIYDIKPEGDDHVRTEPIAKSEPFSSKIICARMQGEKIFICLENGQMLLLNAKGERREELVLDWGDLEPDFRQREHIRFLDENRLLIALNTGSVQIFDLSREGHTRRTVLLPPDSMTRILTMDYNSDGPSRDFLALVRVSEGDESSAMRHPKFCIELWNLRTQSLLKRWSCNDYPFNVQLQITPAKSYLLVRCANGEVRLLCSHQAKLAHPSFFTKIYEAVAGICRSLSSFGHWLRSLFS